MQSLDYIKAPKYTVEQRIKARGWVSSDYGTIKEIKWIFHNRMGEYTWGYKIAFENDGPGLSFEYIPQGYLQLDK